MSRLLVIKARNFGKIFIARIVSMHKTCHFLLIWEASACPSVKPSRLRITGSRVQIPLEARLFPNLNGASLLRAFYVHLSIIWKCLKYCSNPTGGEILPEPKRRFIAQSISCSPFHRLEITEILLMFVNTNSSIHLLIWTTTWQNQQNEHAPSEDLDQPGHRPVWSVFAVRMKKPWVLSYPLSAQRRLIRVGGCPGWSESSLGAHSFCWFCHVAAHIMFDFDIC